MLNKVLLSIEGIALFIGVPSLVFFGFIVASKLTVLVAITLFCVAVLYFDRGFYNKKLWNYEGFKEQLPRILKRFVPACIILTLILLYMEPEKFLILPKNELGLWLTVIVLYPLLSVYPQEIIYRCYFFERYQTLFKKQRLLIHVSALSFGFLHIIYGNYVAIFLTYGAGYLFGRTYAESKSLLAVSFEHSLYGIFIFTIGFGEFFGDSFVSGL